MPQKKRSAPKAQGHEFKRIARYFAPLARDWPGAFNLTDDAALLHHEPDEMLVVTTDAMIEGVHFLATDAPQDIAAKLLNVNLSDLAAMGAEPRAYTLITGLPKAKSERWLAAFAKGLGREQKRHRVSLIGGDSVATTNAIQLAVTAFGIVPVGREVRRTATLPADFAAGDILVSGTIGDAALGLDIATGKRKGVNRKDAAYLLRRHRRPEARTALAPILGRFALAALDISDGLVADIGHIAECSSLDITIDGGKVPLSPAARRLLEKNPALLATLVTGGDDYEIACLVAPNVTDRIIAEARKQGVRLTKIGTARRGNKRTAGVDVLDARGEKLRLRNSGWQHF